jgi:Spy/CpxP family protein refolding chaperone
MFGLTRNSRRVAVALAFCAGLSALPATAQPGPGGDRFIHAIAAFKAQLNLDPTTQQPLWDAAVASGKAARDAAKQRRQTVKQVATEELAKATPPDLSHIAATADQVQDANVAAHRQVRAQWLALYATFTSDQIAVVKAGIAKRMARMESFRERMRQRFGN